MIVYEIFRIGTKDAWYTFSSPYRFELGERIFAEHEGVMHVMTIAKVTHDLRQKESSLHHVVRLNCHAQVYETK